MDPADGIQCGLREGGRHCSGAAEVEALQQVHAEVDDLAQFSVVLNALRNQLHTAGVGIVYDIGNDLLFVAVGVDAADDGNVDLDVPGSQRQKVQLVAVAAAVIIQREGAGEARHVPLPFQRIGSSCSVISTTRYLSSSGKRR